MADTNECRARAERIARESGFTHLPDDTWRSPRGKFEGEQWYAPYYYWDAAMNGDGETIDSGKEDSPFAGLFTVTGEESDAFNLECGACIMVREDSQGFVLVTVHGSTREAKAAFRRWIGE